ncbi:MAG: tellurium resistance protein TerD [Acetobacterium sp.]|nr:tellurium resistance protein TerD [Acetobacterium sp.]
MGISLTKGQKVDLTKGNPNFKKLRVGLGWDTNKYTGGDTFDLDASAFLLDASGRCEKQEDFIFFNNLTGRNGGVVHTGDNLTGEGEGDDESLIVDFAKVPADIVKIAIVATIYQANEKHQNFGQVTNAFIRCVDEDTNVELMRYDLGEDYSTETGLLFAEVYKNNGEWKFSAVGSGYKEGLAGFCTQYGLSLA